MIECKNQISLVAASAINGPVTIDISGEIHNHAGNKNVAGIPHEQLINSRSEGNGIERILKKIHENTLEKTLGNIDDSLLAHKFPEPDFEVYPQIIESPHFYSGGHSVVKKNKTLALPLSDKSPNQHKRMRLKEPEYVKDQKFAFYDDENTGCISKPISMASMMMKINEAKKKLKILGVIAPAGYGKTTCMRRWTQLTMARNGITEENGLASTPGSRYKLVHFLDMKAIHYSDDTTLGEILFRDIFHSRQDMELASEWFFQNQNKTVLFLDGLDQAPWKITEDDVKPISRYTRTTSTAIVANMLTRCLLPQSRIIISSREYSVTSLPVEAWVKDIVTLVGFSEEDAKRLFNFLTTVDSTAQPTTAPLTSWEQLAENSSALLPFISIPAFLMFTVIIFKNYGTAPSSVTELMVKVTETLELSLNIQERKRIYIIVRKLKKLSHDGMKRGLVMFNEADLERCRLEQKDITDLLIAVPKSRLLSHPLITGRDVYIFSHQIFQEFLSACYIAEMELTDFQAFVESVMNDDRWTIVRRFVCGLTFLKSPNKELLHIPHRNVKQSILRKSLISQLEGAERYQPFEVFPAIYETNDDVLIRSINEIKLGYIPLSHGAAHLIGSLLVRINKLELLSLYHCPLTFDSIKFRPNDPKSFRVTINFIVVDIIGNKKERTFLDFFKGYFDARHQSTHWNGILYIHVAPNVDEHRRLCYTDNAACDEVFPVRIKGLDPALEVLLSPATWNLLSALFRCNSYWDKRKLSTDADFRRRIMTMLGNFLHGAEDMSLQYQGVTTASVQFQTSAFKAVVALKNIGSIPVSQDDGISCHCSEMRIDIIDVEIKSHTLSGVFSELKQGQIEYLRLRIFGEIAMDELVTFVKSLTIIKELWIRNISHPLSNSDIQILQVAAECSNTALRFDGQEGPAVNSYNMTWHCLSLMGNHMNQDWKTMLPRALKICHNCRCCTSTFCDVSVIPQLNVVTTFSMDELRKNSVGLTNTYSRLRKKLSESDLPYAEKVDYVLRGYLKSLKDIIYAYPPVNVFSSDTTQLKTKGFKVAVTYPPGNELSEMKIDVVQDDIKTCTLNEFATEIHHIENLRLTVIGKIPINELVTFIKAFAVSKEIYRDIRPPLSDSDLQKISAAETYSKTQGLNHEAGHCISNENASSPVDPLIYTFHYILLANLHCKQSCNDSCHDMC